MSNLKKLYQTDTKKEVEGIWHIVAKNEDGTDVGFKIKRYGGKNIKALEDVVAKYHKPYARAIATNTLDEGKSEELVARALIDCCLVDWKGVRDDKDKDIPYNKDNALRELKDLPELIGELKTFAMNADNFGVDKELGKS